MPTILNRQWSWFLQVPATGLPGDCKNRSPRKNAKDKDWLCLAARSPWALLRFCLGIINSFPVVIYYYGLLVVFLMIGYAGFWLEPAGRNRSWHKYVLAGLDFTLLAFTLLYPNPFDSHEFPPQIGLRFGNFVYFFVLLAGLSISYHPRLTNLGWCRGRSLLDYGCPLAGITSRYDYRDARRP